MSVEISAAANLLQLPIVEPFTQAQPNNPNWRFTNYARLDEGCLVLNTEHTQTPLPGLALLDQPFPSAQGVTIDFDLAKSRGDNEFDGLCVFLIDGQATTGRGSAVGIGYARDDTGQLPGVTAGWVGIGFDNLGYFSGRSGDYYDERAYLLAVRGCGDSSSGFELLSTTHVPGGFGSSWDNGEHIEVRLLDGRLSVRRSSVANPDGELLLDSFDLADQRGQAPIPETFKLGLAGVTFETNCHSQIRNLTVAPASGEDPISVDYEIVGQWSQSYPDDAKGWVVSYDLTLAARDHRVARWDITCDVASRTRVNPTQTQWYRVVQDGSGGTVVIDSPDDSHTIDPATPLTVSLQLLYPSQADAGEAVLRNLRATEIAHP
ncbi:hypothetical protein ACWDYH_35595 [Nocardia goodfellowii]